MPEGVMAALCDDLNTPQILAELSVLTKALETAGSEGARIMAKADLLAAGAVLGLLQEDAEGWFKRGAGDDLTAQVEALLVERAAARGAKNWPESDRIRDALSALNVDVMDGPTGATWKLKVSS